MLARYCEKHIGMAGWLQTALEMTKQWWLCFIFWKKGVFQGFSVFSKLLICLRFDMIN